MATESRRDFLRQAGALGGIALLTPERPQVSSQPSTNEDVFNAILARIKNEVGDRYAKVDELLLKGDRGETIFIGFYTPTPVEPYKQTWIEILDRNNPVSYAVRRGQTSYDTLWQHDIETSEETPISPAPNFRTLFQAQRVRDRIINLVTAARTNPFDNPLSLI